MQFTLTLDDDVAASLERVRKTRKARLRDTINEALRQGLRQMGAPTAQRRPYRTPSTDLGPSLIGSLDNIGRVLMTAEGGHLRDSVRAARPSRRR